MVSKGLDRFVLWPSYFNAKLTRAQGRRVSEELAVDSPDAKWIEVAANRLDLDPQVEAEARHPIRPYERSGRVLVTKKGSKSTVLRMVAEKMRASQESRGG